jgi:hypothetical protein
MSEPLLFDPMHPDIQQEILNNVSTMAGMLEERKKGATQQEIRRYIDSQTTAIYNAYSQSPCVVGTEQLEQLKIYSKILNSQLSTVNSAVSMLETQISAGMPEISMKSFSTLLAEPCMPTTLDQYFRPLNKT